MGGEITSRGPATDGTRVFVGSSDGYLNAVDVATGEPVWSWAFPTGCCSTTAVRDGLLVATGQGENEAGLLVAFDAANGEVRWQYVPEDGSGLRSPSMDETSVYVKGADGTMVSLAVADGTLQWTAAVEPHESPIAVVGGTLVVVGPEDTLTSVDAATGAIGWTVPMGSGVTGGISVANGLILAGTADGRVVAMGQSGEVAASPSPGLSGVLEARIVRTLEVPEGFGKPVDVAFDADGNGWVTEGGTGTIAIFAPDGQFIERWGTAGTADGQFDFTIPGSNDPTGAIAFLPDGGFWISDPGNYRIQQFDADRRWVQSVGHFGNGEGQFMGQLQLARADDGRLFVQDGERNDIQVFEEDGAYLTTIGTVGIGGAPLVDPVAPIVVGDRLLFADGAPLWNTVYALSLDGELLDTLTTPTYQNLADLALGPDGLVYAADWGKYIHVIDPVAMTSDGSWQVLHDDEPTPIDGLGVAPSGQVWAAQWSIPAVEIVELP
jgi:outer membrane protein assembly factor BamB